jgi:hypothetical protein
LAGNRRHPAVDAPFRRRSGVASIAPVGNGGSTIDTYQRALDKIAAAAAKHGVVAAMYFIPPGMDPNSYVEKGFKLFTMPWAPWATAGIQNGLSGIKR